MCLATPSNGVISEAEKIYHLFIALQQSHCYKKPVSWTYIKVYN